MDLRTDKFDWVNEGPGLEENSYKALVEEFPLIDDVVEASLRDLTRLPGVGASYAAKIKKFANEVNKAGKGNSNGEDVIIHDELLDHEPTKEELEELENDHDPEKEYILLEVPVDKFYTKRYRIEVGPVTCRECGFDVIKVNNLPPFESLSSYDKSAVRKTLEEHVKRYHSTPSGKKVITESEMGETSWLHPEVLKP